MTHSNRSEYSDRRPYSDRRSEQWDEYDDRWEERHKPYRDASQDSYHRYCGDRHSSTERTSKGREYSPKRLYNKDSLSREWSRKSPVRRQVSSPDWGASERKRHKYTVDSKDEHRYRPDPKDKTYRHSDSFSRVNVSKDFKHTLPEEEDFKYKEKKAPQDFRHRQWQEESTYRKQRYDYRPLSPYHKDEERHERSWDCSQETTQSNDSSSKSYTKSRERNGSPRNYEDHCQNRTFPLNGSSKQSHEECESEVSNQSPAVNEQRSTEGFQRFLNVLNKGVNVAMLTKIVTQTSTGTCDQPDDSPVSVTNTAVALRQKSPVSAVRQQGRHQNNCYWREHEGSQRVASPQPHHRSFSPAVQSLSEEKSLQTSDGAQSYFHSNSRSRSPLVVEKVTLTPEDEHKHKQIQDVLQAIGMDLGFEEVGQMSHRIQERLYGKKDSDWSHNCTGSKERETKRVSSPRRTSRSSSSRSNLSPFNRDYSLNKDSSSPQRNVTDVHHIKVVQAVEYGQNSSSSSLQDSEKSETSSQKVPAALEAFPPNLAYTVSEAPLTPVMPTYSPVNCPLLPYSALPPGLAPNLPHIVPRLFLPHLPHFVPCPRMPPLNIFPGVLTQTSHLLPQHIGNHRSPFSNLQDINPTQSINTAQKSKTVSRPRCLQVIETKQPG
ncbi:uncharacterized protein [Channa argus]|uniref:uncharacterized protein n=1 Tax=Channa argus TaxID=215402 RepID=UPI0029445CAC|nr:hypothetical protein Q8A73_003848 [Channa argus]